jgi:hypothetical protein
MSSGFLHRLLPFWSFLTETAHRPTEYRYRNITFSRPVPASLTIALHAKGASSRFYPFSR